jgi:diguanylate cyclase (GGDEF)-like protein
MSGDEFLIIYHDINNDDHAHILAKQIIAALNRPVTLAETEITIAASVGLCFFPKEGANVDKLLKCADKAMYAAKNAGRNTFRMCPSGAQKNSG